MRYSGKIVFIKIYTPAANKDEIIQYAGFIKAL
jgi:hypothetical protein